MSRLNKWRPFFYGISEFGPAGIDIFLKVYLLLYFNQIMGLSATYTSVAIGLSVLWDALIDPLIGVYSDNYYRRNRQRKNILYLALCFIALLFYLLWNTNSSNQWVSLALLFFLSSLLNSAISLFSVPFYAVANDLERDNEQRKKWIGWRLAFFNLGSFMGLVIPAYYLTQSKSNLKAEPYLKSVYFLTAMTVIFTTLSVFLTYYKQETPAQLSNLDMKSVSIKTLIKDRRFLQIILSFFIVNCGLGLNSSLALYYYKGYLEFTEKQTQIILVGFLLIFTLSIPLWIYLTRHFDKKKLIITGAALLGAITCFTFPHFKGVDFLIIFTIACGVGGVLVGVAVVLEIFLSEFLREKEDQMQTSVSGQYLGLWKMSSKISRAVAIALAGPIIEAASGKPQLLANFFGWGVGFFFLLSALIMTISIDKKS